MLMVMTRVYIYFSFCTSKSPASMHDVNIMKLAYVLLFMYYVHLLWPICLLYNRVNEMHGYPNIVFDIRIWPSIRIFGYPLPFR